MRTNGNSHIQIAVGTAVAARFTLIVHDNGVMLIFCFAGLVYPLLYNWIYGYGVVDEMPLAVVDLSGGSYSRRYIREIDATREASIAYDCTSLEEARQLMEKQKVHGIILIPSDFDEKLNKMEQATVSTYADMSTFLYYKNMTVATNKVMLDEMHQNKPAGAVSGEHAYGRCGAALGTDGRFDNV